MTAGVPPLLARTTRWPSALSMARPIEWGRPTSSCTRPTKYIGGHGTTMGAGSDRVESGKFDWGNGKISRVQRRPQPGYHGIIFHGGPSADFQLTPMKPAHGRSCALSGPALSPLNALAAFAGGSSPLHVRMERHWRKCLRRGEVPAGRFRASRGWNYRGCPDKTSIFHWRRNIFRRGASGLLNFGRQGAEPRAGERFIEAAQFMSHLANIGDAQGPW